MVWGLLEGGGGPDTEGRVREKGSLGGWKQERIGRSSRHSRQVVTSTLKSPEHPLPL